MTEAVAAPVPTTRRRLPASERRQAIIEAAREVFCEVGLRGARMRLIADRAGVTEPLLYRHFSSREELYRLAVEDHFTGVLDAGAAEARALAAESGLSRPKLIARLNELYLRMMTEVAPLAAVALYEETSRGKTLYQNAIRPRLRTTATALYETAAGKPLPPGGENLVAIAVFGVHFGVALDAMLRGTEVQIDDMAVRITKLFG